MLVVIATHNFTAYPTNRSEEYFLHTFRKKTAQYGYVRQPGGKFSYSVIKNYSLLLSNPTRYIFHINQYTDFKACAAPNNIALEEQILPLPPVKPADIKVVVDFDFRPNQALVYPFLTDGDVNNRAKLVALPPGDGKGFLAAKVMEHFGVTTAFIFRPQWLQKWAKELVRYFGFGRDDFYIVTGLDTLIQLSKMLKRGHPGYKVYLISNKTYQLYLQEYEKKGDLTLHGYIANPPEFLQALGVGMRITDEGHLDFHLNYLIELYTHVNLSLTMSGSMKSLDKFINKLYEIMFPLHLRGPAIPVNKYMNVKAYSYGVDQSRNVLQRIQTSEWGCTSYSHNAFEKSILRNPYFVSFYMGAINYIVIHEYLHKRKPGQKLRIFASLSAMCAKIVESLKRFHPEEDIRKYVSTDKDPYDNLLNAGICVTTPGSGGTGHDIPDVIATINTVVVQSIQGNLQISGRGREIVGENVIHAYLFCSEIPKQQEYHETRLVTLGEVCKTFETYTLPFIMK